MDTTSYADSRGHGKVYAGGGSDAILPDCRVAFGALVAPAPGTSGIENVSDADTGLICAGYEVDQFSIHC